MQRILFFVHYNKYDGLAAYVLYLLQAVRPIFNRIVFVSNSAVSSDGLIKLEKFCDDISIRENRGFDFGAWKQALLREGWEKLSGYDNVTLMNDTCFGPVFDLAGVYRKMEHAGIDFWGLTNNGSPGVKTPSVKTLSVKVPVHIQSYFLCFNKKVVASGTFRSFWDNVHNFDDVGKVVRTYEIPLTGILTKAGFTHSVVFNTLPFIQDKDIAAFAYPDLMIDNNVPLLKIKSFQYYLYQNNIINLLRTKTSYPLNLIYDHITEIFTPEISLRICDKLIPAYDNTKPVTAPPDIAIHLHVTGFDYFKKHAYHFAHVPANVDFFITTNSTGTKDQLPLFLKDNDIHLNIQEIIAVENTYNNILAWLSIAKKLEKYVLAGHFHTEELSCHGFAGQNLFELLLTPLDIIINNFDKDENIGIIMAQPPSYLCTYTQIKNNMYISETLNRIWNTLNYRKKVDFTSLKMTVIPYGQMFWYRPGALKTFCNVLNTQTGNETVVPCVEQIIVYSLWNDGFDYRIMVPVPQRIDDIITGMELLNRLESSTAYRLGKAILALPKKLYQKYL